MHAAWKWMVVDYQWPYAAFFAALMLLVLSPWLALTQPLALVLVFLQLPAYMIHQLEEHANDRFRLFLNTEIAGGLPALTRPAAFWINSVGVWAPLVFAFYAQFALAPAWSLIGSYLLVINAVVHIASMLITRGYNPGLITAILLLLPLGLVSIAATALPLRSHLSAHLLCAGLIVVLHACIILHVLRRKRTLLALSGGDVIPAG